MLCECASLATLAADEKAPLPDGAFSVEAPALGETYSVARRSCCGPVGIFWAEELNTGSNPNWTVKLEYHYLKLGSLTAPTVPAEWRLDTQMIKLGMNYKFQSGNSDDATGTPDDAKGSSRAKGRGTTEDLAKASQNPIASLVSVPFQNNTNPNVGPFNRTQNVLNIEPVVPMSLNAQWNVISSTIIPVTSQPNPLIDSSTNGVGDMASNGPSLSEAISAACSKSVISRLMLSGVSAHWTERTD